jgi:hypothetical protein
LGWRWESEEGCSRGERPGGCGRRRRASASAVVGVRPLRASAAGAGGGLASSGCARGLGRRAWKGGRTTDRCVACGRSTARRPLRGDGPRSKDVRRKGDRRPAARGRGTVLHGRRGGTATGAWRAAQPGQERPARRRRSRAQPCSVPAGQRIFGWVFLQKIE